MESTSARAVVFSPAWSAARAPNSLHSKLGIDHPASRRESARLAASAATRAGAVPADHRDWASTNWARAAHRGLP